MTAYAALLRAVNVGGTGKLPMAELRAMCEAEGFAEVRTYIASGNAVFSSGASAEAVRSALEARLEAYAGRPVGVTVRTREQMRDVLAANPFSDESGDRSVAIFFETPPPSSVLDGLRGADDERVALGVREIYVAYPSGMGRSKLVVPGAAEGTARNMNTVAKLVEMLGEVAG